jgi:hypothetical protein
MASVGKVEMICVRASGAQADDISRDWTSHSNALLCIDGLNVSEAVQPSR